jgi:hypothetical protein
MGGEFSRELHDSRVCVETPRRESEAIRREAGGRDCRGSFHQKKYVVLGDGAGTLGGRRAYRVREALSTGYGIDGHDRCVASCQEVNNTASGSMISQFLLFYLSNRIFISVLIRHIPSFFCLFAG